MSTDGTRLHMPSYYTFVESIAILALPISASELHGVMCGYLCAGATKKGEAYLRALVTNKSAEGIRLAKLALFGVYAVSQQQITSFDFEFQMLLPDEDHPLMERAKAFSEWCEGFTQGVCLAGVKNHQLQEEEAKEALHHLTAFAQLDYQELHIGEDDEKSLMEVNEYARLAVLRIYGDLYSSHLKGGASETSH